jgi:hypothetical protein
VSSALLSAYAYIKATSLFVIRAAFFVPVDTLELSDHLRGGIKLEKKHKCRVYITICSGACVGLEAKNNKVIRGLDRPSSWLFVYSVIPELLV